MAKELLCFCLISAEKGSNTDLPDGAKATVIAQVEKEFPLKARDYQINDAFTKFSKDVLVIHEADGQEVFIEKARQMVAGHEQLSLIETRGEGHRKILTSRSLIAIIASFL